MIARRPVLSIRRIVAEGLVVLVVAQLCFMLCWYAVRVLDPMGAAIPVPVGFGRELDVNYWTTARGLGVALWYQDASVNVRLATTEVIVGWW